VRAAPLAYSPDRSNAYRAILFGGLVVGILDITFAFVFYGLLGATPVRILQSVASGLLGARAYEGGAGTAALGGVLHFFIATVVAAVYYVASRRLGFLIENAVLWGPIYGIVVYAVMNLVVIPLSAVPNPRYSVLIVVVGVIGHMVLIGLPAALIVRRYSR
jgi:hypothetical protein